MYRMRYPKHTPRCRNCGYSSAPRQRIFTAEEGGEWVHLCTSCDGIWHDYYVDRDAIKRDTHLKEQRRLMGAVDIPFRAKDER